MEHSQITMEARFDSLVTELSFLQDDQGKLANKVADGETAVAALQPTAVDYQTAIQNLCDQVRHLENRVDDLEGSSWRTNIPIHALPEGIEGSDTLTYVEHLLKTFTPETELSPFYPLERAY
ncbi:hypothetical protein NDU88_000897 [Pleurodeles waltl]|uniref:Uncharacterized protein n=1 Tax=Pleurodeles waltl TaxID=8319 RepID=A0AAV7V8F4_PLEWA|nr:hypothetical protein NDU88_000897 [Pleurodeles waltl]